MSTQQPRGTSPITVALILLVALLAVAVIVWAAMPMFGPMPGMGH